MSDDTIEELRLKMLEAEAKLIDHLPEYALEEVIYLIHDMYNDVLYDTEVIKNSLRYNRKSAQEGFFSTFRIIKAALAEIEYRIRENKI